MGLRDLTDRERSVLEARISGEQLKDIAARMLGTDGRPISIGSVWEYQDRAMKKLGARTIAGARRRFQQLLSADQVAAATS